MHKLKRRKLKSTLVTLIALIAAAAALLTLASCGGEPVTPPTPSNTQAGAVSPAQTPASPSETPAAPSYLDTVSEIVMCYLPNEGSDEYTESRGFLHRDLGDYLGVEVTEINAADYNAVVEAMRTKNADIASFGPVSYVQAHDRSNAEALVLVAPDGKKELTGYTSLIITQPSSSVKTLSDLEGRSFAYVDPASTSGNYVPTLEFMNAFPGKTNEDFHSNGAFFSSVTFSGKHQNSVYAVVNGDVDAAAVASDTLRSMILNGEVSEDQFVVIHESAKIPTSPIAIRGDLPQDLKDKVKEFFLGYRNDEYFAAIYGLTPEDNASFIEADDSDYDYVRELMEKVMPPQ
ncbi:MAG: phosphate/phosphite/phosphonate ABC transporter substrate-binding protein [Oscillospiraceae bacterium]|jgi:phosphonate transport system substrate-binding protein|nr:phosphate/phosphite/phosphonate ABC transporter substrate-binding protein [Oscillospiraceae bacterium]